MILSQFKEVIWHWRSSDGDVAEPWHHSGEIVSSVETIFEFGEVARYVLVPDGTVSAGDGAFDVSEGSVDPPERGGQSDLAARSSDDRLMDAPGVADTRETSQTVTDDSASGIEIALRQGSDLRAAETRHAAQFQTDWLALWCGFDRRQIGVLPGEPRPRLPPFRSPPR